LRNATTAPADFVAWAASEAERSPRFQASIDRLRALAAGETRAGYPRTTGPLTGQAWPALEQILADASRRAQHHRPYAWKNTELATDDGLRHLRDYLRGCRKVGRQFLGHPDTGPLVHQLVRATGYQAIVPTTISPPAPTGPAASNLAAHITGASWRSGATAHRQAWRRARPAHLDTFLLG
jgi:hypothetical protein